MKYNNTKNQSTTDLSDSSVPTEHLAEEAFPFPYLNT